MTGRFRPLHMKLKSAAIFLLKAKKIVVQNVSAFKRYSQKDTPPPPKIIRAKKRAAHDLPPLAMIKPECFA